MESIENNILHIKNLTEKFFNHLESIERLLKQNNLIEKKDNDQSNVIDIGSFVDVVLNLKYQKIQAEKEGNLQAKEEAIEKLNAFEIVDDNLKKTIELINLIPNEKKSGNLLISIKSPILKAKYEEFSSERRNKNYDIGQYNNSLVVSMVIGLEILIGDLFKHYIDKVDVSNQLIKDKELTFSELRDFETIEDAKIYLQDSYIDKLLRSSFEDWVKNIDDKMKLNLQGNKIISNDIKSVVETLQRRHLIIHNDGLVNDFYLRRVDSSLLEGVKKGEKLLIGEDYITKRIGTIRKFGIILIHSYCIKLVKKETDLYFSTFNDLMLTMMDKNCDGVRFFYKEYSELAQNNSDMLISKINYYLSHKMHGIDTLDDKIEKFDTDSLSLEFKLAKNILLKKAEANKLAIEFLSTIPDASLNRILNWPLFKYFEKSEETVKYLEDRHKTLMDNEFAKIFIEVAEQQKLEKHAKNLVDINLTENS